MQAGLTNIADRVNVGLIPSSEEGWPLACAALKRCTGGWLHIHGNVTTKLAGDREASGDCEPCSDEQFERYYHLLSLKCLKTSAVIKWLDYVIERVTALLQEQRGGNGGASLRPSWSVDVKHVEHVKSYAPHIRHLVLDLECRPCTMIVPL